jgi:hypothetical protein
MKTLLLTPCLFMISLLTFAGEVPQNTPAGTCVHLDYQTSNSPTIQANIFQKTNGKVGVVWMGTESVQIQIRDGWNETLQTIKPTETSALQQLDLSHLDKGVYSIYLFTGNQCYTKTVERK